MYVDTRMWGLLGKGRLEYWLLPEVVDEKGRKSSADMNGDMYEKLVKRSFKAWRKKMLPHAGSTKIPIVNDYEKSLRQDNNFKAEAVAGLKTLKEHPKLAPDLNAIENV